MSVSLILLASCGSGGGVTGGSGSPNAIIKVGVDMAATGDISLDPGMSNAAKPEFPVSEAIYDTMIRKDGTELTPGLATSWDVPDPLTIVLTLRSGVRFQDGTDFNSEAVKVSWDRLLKNIKDGKLRQASAVLSDIESIEATSEDKVTLHLASPVAASLLNYFIPSSQYLGVASPTALKKYGANYADHPVGAGPFKLVSVQKRQQISLRKWDGYWDDKSYRFGGVDLINSTGGTANVTALETGRVDIAPLSSDTAAGLEGSPDLKVLKVPSTSEYQAVMPPCAPPFNDPNVRKAIQIGIDREEFVKALDGTGTASPLPVPPGTPYFFQDLADTAKYDPGAAKALLAKGGPYAPIKLMVKNSPKDLTMGLVMQLQLEKLGFKVTITPTTNPGADLAALRPMYLTFSDIQVMSGYFDERGGGNPCNYSNKTLSAAWASAIGDGALDKATVESKWRTAFEILLKDAPVTYVMTLPVLLGYSPHIHGMAAYTIDQAGPVLRNLTVSK